MIFTPRPNIEVVDGTILVINKVWQSGSGCWHKKNTHKVVHEILPSFWAKPWSIITTVEVTKHTLLGN